MTFSIVARDPKTKALGVCVCSAVPAVGSVVPHVRADVGAVATQAQTAAFYGVEGLRLLKRGLSPEAALNTLLSMDPNTETRQVIIIDSKGRTTAFTGGEIFEWKGHLLGEDHVVAGNMLAGSSVLEAMSQEFEAKEGSLAERLLQALEAGQGAGGDRRGHMSAALMVSDRQWQSQTRPLLDLRVDAHINPVKELRRVYSVSRRYFQASE